MKQKIFGLCLVLAMLSMLPLQAQAKKIQLGQFVTYNGKVNSQGIPEGKGTLETTYGSKDVLKGEFKNGQVKKALLLFNAIDKNNYKAKFEGTVKCEVSPDGSSVTYTLQSGIFYVASSMFYVSTKRPSFVITRTPSATECKLKTEGQLTKSARWTPDNEFGRKIYNLGIGEVRENSIMTTYVIDENFTPQETGKYHLIVDMNNRYIQVYENKVYITYPNNDYVCYELGSEFVIEFRKTKPEGTITFKGEPCMEFISSTNQKGTAYFEEYPRFKYGQLLYDFWDRDNSSLSDLKIRTFLGSDFNDEKTKLEVKGYVSLIEAVATSNNASKKQNALTQKLFAIEDSNEKIAALTNVYNGLKWARWYGSNLLARQIENEMRKKGHKTFGFLPGQREDDIVFVDSDKGALGGGSVIRRKNGTLYVGYDGKMKLVMNDGSEFTGFFKEQLTYFGDSNQYSQYTPEADIKLLLADEFTPYEGHIKYADGTSDELNSGVKKSQILRKEQQEKDAKKKQIAQVRAAYTKKYGASYSNYLSKQGYIVKGMPIAFIREYINDFNRLGFYLLGNQVQLRLQEYQPTVRDMMQFGRAVKSYRLIAGSEQMWAFLVLNGKVVSCSKLSIVYDLIKMVD